MLTWIAAALIASPALAADCDAKALKKELADASLVEGFGSGAVHLLDLVLARPEQRDTALRC